MAVGERVGAPKKQEGWVGERWQCAHRAGRKRCTIQTSVDHNAP